MRVELAVEHVVLALMPDDGFELVAHSASVEFLQRILNEFECPRIKLLSLLGRARIPIEGQVGAADGRLDDGDRRIVVLLHHARKSDLRTKRIARSKRSPGSGRVATRGGTRGGIRGGKSGEEDIVLHCARALKHRKFVDVFRVRIGANHVRLSREDEDFDGRGRDRSRGRVEDESGQGESNEELKKSHGGARW